MKNGIYQYAIKMSAPTGPRYGSLELSVSGDAAAGFLTMFSKRLPISEGSCRDGSLRFSGYMQTLRYLLPYTAEGTVNGQRVQVVFSTDKGRFPAEGVAAAEEERQSHE